MVIRSVVGGLAAPSPRSRPLVSLLLVFAAAPWLLPGALSAQQPADASGSPQPGTPSESSAPQPVVWGKIVGEQVRLRCWTGSVATPPLFEDVLQKDQIVKVGRSENGFREILLPMGPIGYVSKRFATSAEDGTVTSNGSKVAFRYRPRTSEAPVAQLADGTPIHVIGEQDDWYRGRVAGIDAWVPAADVQILDEPGPAALAAYAEFEAKTRAEAQARLDAIAAEQERKQQEKIELEAVRVVEEAFAKELAKPATEQQFAPLQTALAKLVETLAEDSAARTAVAALEKRIETQQWIAEATAVKNSEPPVDDEPAPPPPPVDRLERFESIGWLRYERHLAGPGVFYLEKGGRRQFLLSCNTGRYDLALFVGREVGVIGPRRQPPGELSVLDVERIEVLGSTKP